MLNRRLRTACVAYPHFNDDKITGSWISTTTEDHLVLFRLLIPEVFRMSFILHTHTQVIIKYKMKRAGHSNTFYLSVKPFISCTTVQIKLFPF